ncbi:MAG: putative two component, sigma54 specific, transcriptional regulator [Bacteroidetes bacterium]|jgi:DNA-binding NtrC family response regulator|nr:putative two component, sigma54 specific, transcriptional regulator [Bacteroidota bacterium]
MKQHGFTICVIEDNEWYNKLLVHTLSLNPDFTIKSYLTADSFLKDLDTSPDLVTLDVRLPDMSGTELFKKIKEHNPNIQVIIISEQDEIQTAVDFLKNGAYDYIVKEKDIKTRLHHSINLIRANRQLEDKIAVLEKEVINKYDLQKTIIGNSSAVQNVLKLVEKTLENNITVVITGETGTGKEVVAKAIHYNSIRKNKNFIAVNVAAIPSELIESELFGHEKGSFTGANNRRIGKFEEANGGTLFLDEIGELDLSLQAKLLRALQEKEITRIGSNAPIKFDSRIIVATHRNLKEEIKTGRFREDLFYRLMGFPIELPPLRSRGQDVLVLAKYFINGFCKENKIPIKTLTEEAKNKLLNYHYPGNIRELKSVIEFALVIGSNKEIIGEDISFISDELSPEIVTEEMSLREYELKIVSSFLKKYNNDVKMVAEKLNIGQATVYRMIKELNGTKIKAKEIQQTGK